MRLFILSATLALSCAFPETWVRFLQGYMHYSPPVFLLALRERYKAVK